MGTGKTTDPFANLERDPKKAYRPKYLLYPFGSFKNADSSGAGKTILTVIE